MFEWVKDVLVGGLAAFFGGMLSLLFGYGYWTRLNKKVDEGVKEVERLRDDNITKLEKDLKNHIKDDKSQAILRGIENLENSFSTLEKDVKDHIKDDKTQQVLTQMESVSGSLAKVGDKVDVWGNKTSEQGAQISGNAKYIENVDKSFQNHKREKH